MLPAGDSEFHLIIYLGSLLAFLVGLGQLVRGLIARNLILAAFLFCIGAIQAVSVSINDPSLKTQNAYLILYTGLVFGVGPLLYLYFLSLIDEKFHFRPILIVHFAPAFLICSALLFAEILSPGFLARLSEGFHSERGFSLYKAILTLAGIFALAYIVYFLIIIISAEKRGSGFPKRSIIINSLIGIAGGSAVIITAAVILNVQAIMNLLITALLLSFYLMAQRWPFLLNHIAANVRLRMGRSLLNGLDLKEIRVRLTQLLEEEKLFCDEDLSLARLSEHMGLSTHQLSQYLNEHEKMNFNNFINTYRVREAQTLLLESNDRTTLSVGLAVGFNSNSAFHAAFVKITGMSPGQFRKSHS